MTNEEIDSLIQGISSLLDSLPSSWHPDLIIDTSNALYQAAQVSLLAEIAKRMPPAITKEDIEHAVWRAMNPS